MLLVIDIGNTHVAAGLYEGEKLVTYFRIMSNHERTEDETWILMHSIAAAHGFDIMKATGVAITSVVPDVTNTFEKMATKYLQTEPVVVGSELDLGISVEYDNPSSVGADRLCNAVGGFFKHSGPLIIVDFGTATTFDVVSETGNYLGGIISPGIEMTSKILHEKAAKLPRVELKFPPTVIGHSTEKSMQSGIMYGAVDLVSGMIKRIKAELGQDAKCIATGGLAKHILGELESYEMEPFLTLEGLRIIYERVQKKPF